MAINLFTEQSAIIQRLTAQVVGVRKVVGAQYYARTREMAEDLPLIAVLPGSSDFQTKLDGSVAVVSQDYIIAIVMPYVADDASSTVALEAAAGNLINQCVAALEGWQPLPQNSGGQFFGVNQPAFADGQAEFSLTVRYSVSTY